MVHHGQLQRFPTQMEDGHELSGAGNIAPPCLKRDHGQFFSDFTQYVFGRIIFLFKMCDFYNRKVVWLIGTFSLVLCWYNLQFFFLFPL